MFGTLSHFQISENRWLTSCKSIFIFAYTRTFYEDILHLNLESLLKIIHRKGTSCQISYQTNMFEGRICCRRYVGKIFGRRRMWIRQKFEWKCQVNKWNEYNIKKFVKIQKSYFAANELFTAGASLWNILLTKDFLKNWIPGIALENSFPGKMFFSHTLYIICSLLTI